MIKNNNLKNKHFYMCNMIKVQFHYQNSKIGMIKRIKIVKNINIQHMYKHKVMIHF